MLSEAVSMPPRDGNAMATLEIVSSSLILVLESFTDADLQAHVFSSSAALLNEGLIQPFYEKVISFLKTHREMSPEVFNQSQGCTVISGNLERICKRYLAYKRSVLGQAESPEDGEDTPIKNVAKPLLLGLATFAPERARPIAEEYAEFNTIFCLCSSSRGKKVTDFEMLGNYIKRWPKFELFVYESWFRDRYFHRNFFDSRLESRRPVMRDFLCEESHISELTTTFLLEFSNDRADIVEDVAAKLLFLAQDALFLKKRPLDALDFAASAKMLLFAIGRAGSPEYVLAAFIESVVSSQEGKESVLELDPAKVLTNALLGADEDCDGDRERKCSALRTALDFVRAIDSVVGYSEAGNPSAERFVAGYCRVLGNENLRDREGMRMELCKIVFGNAYEATNWEGIENPNGDWNALAECLNETPIVDLGRYAFVELEMPKEFVCGVVHAVTKGQNLIPIMLDLMFTKCGPAFVDVDNGDNNVDDDDDDDDMVGMDDDDDDN